MLSAEEALLRLSAVVLVLEELLHDKKNPASSNEKITVSYVFSGS
jgi:hypothetical protein